MQNTSPELPAETTALLIWYRASHRALPWREDPSPYHVWLSEIMLQQTRVEAVKSYYTRFLDALPDIASLAAAPEDQVLKLWEGLGYYSRARNLQKAARVITEEFGGLMPSTYDELLKLPGIGPYTAAAIASIAFRERVSAVDGNVLRVMTRLRADARDIALEQTKRAVKKEIEETYLPADGNDCGDFNQALMELGAVICVPNGEPDCVHCPWETHCLAHRAGKETDYPVKQAKKERRIKRRTIFLICDRERVLLRRRPAKGLLGGLCEYPGTDTWLSEPALRKFLKENDIPALRISPLPDAKHIFTHVEWHMRGYLIFTETMPDDTSPLKDAFFVNRRMIEETYAIPSAFRVYTDIVKSLLPE